MLMILLSSSFQGYAWEITTVEGGYGLQDLLSSRKSVINGTLTIPHLLQNKTFFLGEMM